jgi:NADH-quinone oxidoreductase E subunit
MAWIAEDRRATKVAQGGPLLTEEMKSHLRDVHFPRYPTKRAVLLPALHLVQHTYNWIPTQAIQEIAEFLEVAPAEAIDTATFYEEYWLKPKGKYLLQVCRSLSCEVCDSRKLTDHLCKKYNIEEGETTPDGRFTIVELECLGACGTAPVALVNEVLHENLTVEALDKIVSELPEEPHDYKDPTITWEEGHDEGHGASHGGGN